MGIHSQDGKRIEKSRPRLKAINRKQMVLRPTDVERLVPEDHEVRAIWEFVGSLDLGRYYEEIEVVEGEAGRSALDDLFIQGLGLLSAEGLVTLERVMQDGRVRRGR